MADDTKDQIEQRIEELPQDVRDAALSAQLGEHLREIGQKHNLHIDQIGKLEDEAMLVMLGFFDPAQFNKQLEEQLAVTPENASAIAADVNSAVFAPIRESLMHFLDMKRSSTTTSTPTASPTQSSPSAPTTYIAPPTPNPALPPMPAAEQLLTEKTAVIAPTPVAPKEIPAKPIYKTDPYREPIE
jgi:hypothetical protein